MTPRLPATLPLEALRPAPWNPRGLVAEATLAELVESIRVQGILTPLLVRRVLPDDHEVGASPDPSEPRFEIVAGHRRYQAARLARLATVPVVVRDLDDDQAREVAIIENLQREDIRPLDEARSFQALLRAETSPASIAARVGKPERYVWDRIRLLQLAPEAQALLETDRITVQHAIVLSKLTAADQARLLDPEVRDGRGLFEREDSLLDEADDREPGPWDGVKAVSVRELVRNIARYVRFNVQHAAAAAPLDFGPVAERVAIAEAQPGRKRKVVSITRDSFVQQDARDADGDRTYCVSSWKRADGQDGGAVCEASVLGVVVVGPGQGECFEVCVNKACDTHWKVERLRREKAQRHAPATASRESAQDQWKREQARQERDRQIWAIVQPQVTQAIVAATAKVPTKDTHLAEALGLHGETHQIVLSAVGSVTHKTFGRAWVLARTLSRLWNVGEATRALKEVGCAFDLKAALKDAAATLDAPTAPAPVTKRAARTTKPVRKSAAAKTSTKKGAKR